MAAGAPIMANALLRVSFMAENQLTPEPTGATLEAHS
jgi:hypothetical protein